MIQKTKKSMSVLLSLLMVLSVFSGMAFTASAADAKAISLGETYYIGDTIEFTGALPYVRYDDDTSADYSAKLVAGDNTTVTTPTFDMRCSQWKFTNVWKYDYYGFTSNILRITGTADVQPVGFKCASGSGTQSNPFTFVGVYAATGVALDSVELSMIVGDTQTLTASVTPDNATDKSVTWSSNDESVATVADGVVTAVGAGETNITVTTTDGEFTATCTVTVTDPVAEAKEQLTTAVDAAKAFYDTIKDEDAYAAVADTLDTVIQQGEAMLNSDNAEEILAKAEQVTAAAAAALEQKDVIDEAAALADAKEQLTNAIDAAKAFYEGIKDSEKYAEIANALKTAFERGEAALASDDAQEVLDFAANVAFALTTAKADKTAADAEPITPDKPDTSDEPTENGNTCPICGKTEHNNHRDQVLHAVMVFVYDLITKVLLPLAKMFK